MKTFSQLIEEMDWEPTHQKSMSELIFDTPDIGQTKSVADNMWMPMSSGLFKRVMPDMVKATVFHVTGLEEQIDQLIKIQNSNKSISTFANMNANRIRAGVEGGSGLVVEIEGGLRVPEPLRPTKPFRPLRPPKPFRNIFHSRPLYCVFQLWGWEMFNL